MINGEMYLAWDDQLVEERVNARRLTEVIQQELSRTLNNRSKSPF
ncbi:maltose acetyltransferase domain-containing protein [Gottfriedia acidiceleris]|nr:maltose acetyltransferase domain-containing protein [Gottfriedia acidiceleris]